MDLNGIWFNQLGSMMTLSVTGKQVNGVYHTNVGNAKGDYQLTGQIDIDNDASNAIGWVVVWNNEFGSSDSVTAWSGQFRINNGEETISTFWLKTKESEVINEWSSTIIGRDIFTKNKPLSNNILEMNIHGNQPSFPEDLLKNS